jgi:hypothetical protein
MLRLNVKRWIRQLPILLFWLLCITLAFTALMQLSVLSHSNVMFDAQSAKQTESLTPFRRPISFDATDSATANVSAHVNQSIVSATRSSEVLHATDRSWPSQSIERFAAVNHSISLKPLKETVHVDQTNDADDSTDTSGPLFAALGNAARIRTILRYAQQTLRQVATRNESRSSNASDDEQSSSTARTVELSVNTVSASVVPEPCPLHAPHLGKPHQSPFFVRSLCTSKDIFKQFRHS